MSSFVEIPASKKSLAKRKPVCDVGTNDADYMVTTVINGKMVSCPYYRSWRGMITRCYSEKSKSKHPTYIGCTVINEWLTFSIFRKWMEKQDWKGKQLDKDILISGNKEYSPKSCIFVSSAINKLLTDRAASRGVLPQGVRFDRDKGRYRAHCSVNGKPKHLGVFPVVSSAEYAYLSFKAALIKKISNESEALGYPKLQAALVMHSEVFKQKADKLRSGK